MKTLITILIVIAKWIGTKMSRIARENPEATYEELFDLGLRGSVRVREGEQLHQYDCRQCGEIVMVDQEQHERLQYFRSHPKEFGTRTPKCGDCWVN